MRLVNTAADQWMASARCRASAWLETSITTASSPAASMSAKVALQVDRLGGGARDGVLLAPDDGGHRAQQAGRAPAGLQQRPHQEGRRRLAVGAGDPDGGAGARWGRRPARRRPAPSRRARRRRGSRGRRRRSGRWTTSATAPRAIGIVGEVVAVTGEARHAEEQRARGHEAVVVGEGRDVDVGRVAAPMTSASSTASAYCGGMRM